LFGFQNNADNLSDDRWIIPSTQLLANPDLRTGRVTSVPRNRGRPRGGLTFSNRLQWKGFLSVEWGLQGAQKLFSAVDASGF
jgi:hypothetical protein